MLRSAALALASFALVIASGCAAPMQGACTCQAAGNLTAGAGVQTGGSVDSSATAGWNGSQTGSATPGTGVTWTTGTPTGTQAGWTGGTQTGAGWNGGTQAGAGWNGSQTASWNGGGQVGGGVAVGGQAGGREGGTVAGGPAFYGIPLAGAQDVIFVLDHSGSMSTADQGPVGLPASPLGALAVGMQAMQGFTLTSAPTALTPAALTTALNPAALFAVGSAPLAPSKLQTAKSELMGALAALPDGTRFNVVFFNDLVSSESQGLMVMNPLTRMQSLAYVQGVGASGETAAVPAMRTAYTSRPARVVFLSDGLANRGGTPQQLMAEARMQMRRGVRFDTVGIGPDQDAALMQALASESGGIVVRR